MEPVKKLIAGLTFISALIVSPLLPAQEKMKPGKIDIQDLQMTVCPLDSSADAMILGDIGNTHFTVDESVGFMMVFERLLRIKIFTKDGLSWANQLITLYKAGPNEEKFITLKGRTFNLVNGKIIESKLENKSIITDKEDKYCIIKKLIFQNVKEGSVIELEYSILSPLFLHIRPWEFQTSIPVRWSEYEFFAPEFLHFSKKMTGNLPFTIDKHGSKSAVFNLRLNNVDKPQGTVGGGSTFHQDQLQYTELTFRLALENAPAFKEEPYISSPSNFVNGIRYDIESYQFPGNPLIEFITSWKMVAEILLKDENFGPQLKKDGLVKDIVKEINGKANAPVDRMLLAYDYVKNNYKWNSKNSDYVTTSLNEVIKEKSGNSADLNLLLVLILRNLDLQADPVVLSTRQNGILLESHPSLTQLDYVIANVDIEGKDYLLDATDISRPYNKLPFQCLNGNGFLIGQAGGRWIPLLTEEKDNSMYNADFTIDNEGKITGTLKVSSSGYQALSFRNDFLSKGKETCIKEFCESLQRWGTSEVNFENIENISEPVIKSCNLQSKEIVKINGDLMYLSPLLSFGKNTNPFSKEKREYPVDFGCPLKEYYLFNFEIPEGYKVLSYPEPVKVGLEDQSATFKFLTVVKERKISVTSVMQVNKAVFDTTEYNKLREFYTQVIAKQAQQIVLTKK